jgi:hypothetical protein
VARVAFKSLNVFGYGSPVDYQTSVGTGLLEVPTIKWQALGRGKQRVDILRDLEGLVLPGNTCMSLVPGLQLLNVSQNHCGRESRSEYRFGGIYQLPWDQPQTDVDSFSRRGNPTC